MTVPLTVFLISLVVVFLLGLFFPVLVMLYFVMRADIPRTVSGHEASER